MQKNAKMFEKHWSYNSNFLIVKLTGATESRLFIAAVQFESAMFNNFA